MNITDNGTHYFPQAFQAGRLCLLDISGDLGGGTVTPGYLAGDGAFSPFVTPDGSGPIVVASRGGFQVRAFREGKVGVLVAGAVTPLIVLDVIPAVDMPPGS